MHITEFKSLVADHKNRLFRIANWMLHNTEDAEDLVQEVFLKLWDIRDSLSKYRSIEALLVTMTKNMCLNLISKKKLEFQEYPMEWLNTQSDEKKLEHREELGILQQIIDALPEQQKIVMQLKGVEQLETNEIAELLGETENHVRVILCRARKSVKEAYQKTLRVS
jgi:RNA polymerase sigma factor (sigma-70 family)